MSVVGEIGIDEPEPLLNQALICLNFSDDGQIAYFDAMQARNANPDLALYTPATRHMLRAWVITPAQMDNVVRSYRHCAVSIR